MPPSESGQTVQRRGAGERKAVGLPKGVGKQKEQSRTSGLGSGRSGRSAGAEWADCCGEGDGVSGRHKRRTVLRGGGSVPSEGGSVPVFAGGRNSKGRDEKSRPSDRRADGAVSLTDGKSPCALYTDWPSVPAGESAGGRFFAGLRAGKEMV